MRAKKIIYGILLHVVVKTVNIWEVILTIQSLHLIKLQKLQKLYQQKLLQQKVLQQRPVQKNILQEISIFYKPFYINYRSINDSS